MGKATIQPLDGTHARKAETDLRLIYSEAFAEAPYEKTEADADANFRRFRSQASVEVWAQRLA